MIAFKFIDQFEVILQDNNIQIFPALFQSLSDPFLLEFKLIILEKWIDFLDQDEANSLYEVFQAIYQQFLDNP